MEVVIIGDYLELINDKDIFSCKVDDGKIILDMDAIDDTCKEEFESLLSYINPEQIERGKENVRFNQNSLLVDFPST